MGSEGGMDGGKQGRGGGGERERNILSEFHAIRNLNYLRKGYSL